MSAYPGRNGVVYISTTGGGVATAVIKLNKWAVDSSTDKIPTTSFGDANKTYVQGLPDIKGSFSGFWDDTETKITTGAASTTGIVMYLYPSSQAPSKFKAGPAWLDQSIEVDVNGSINVNATFVANGSWAGSTI